MHSTTSIYSLTAGRTLELGMLQWSECQSSVRHVISQPATASLRPIPWTSSDRHQDRKMITSCEPLDCSYRRCNIDAATSTLQLYGSLAMETNGQPATERQLPYSLPCIIRSRSNQEIFRLCVRHCLITNIDKCAEDTHLFGKRRIMKS